MFETILQNGYVVLCLGAAIISIVLGVWARSDKGTLYWNGYNPGGLPDPTDPTKRIAPSEQRGLEIMFFVLALAALIGGCWLFGKDYYAKKSANERTSVQALLEMGKKTGVLAVGSDEFGSSISIPASAMNTSADNQEMKEILKKANELAKQGGAKREVTTPTEFRFITDAKQTLFTGLVLSYEGKDKEGVAITAEVDITPLDWTEQYSEGFALRLLNRYQKLGAKPGLSSPATTKHVIPAPVLDPVRENKK